MPVKSETQFAILAMLAIRPMSAYDLVKFADNSIGFFWNESYGNIHKNLQKMDMDGYVHLIGQDSAGRRRKIYAITENGTAYLNTWIAQDPDEIIIRDAMLLKLFSAELDQFPQLRRILQDEEQAMRQAQAAFNQIKTMLNTRDQDPIRKALWLLTMRYGQEYAKTRQAWCREAINALSDMERV